MQSAACWGAISYVTDPEKSDHVYSAASEAMVFVTATIARYVLKWCGVPVHALYLTST